jgi:hypothetical protein
VGNGSTIARSQAANTPNFRIFIVGQNGTLTLQNTRVTGGALSSQDRGGGVYRRSGTLVLNGCTISGNTAYLGGGVANSVGGTVTIANSTISGNTATANQGGGGVFNNGNVGNLSGTLIVRDSVISGNRAKFGGGLRNDGIASISNSTISGNLASGAAAGSGGGIANVFRGSLTLANSTISGNSASSSGAGIDNYQGVLTLTNSTISGNSAGFVGGGALNSFGRLFFNSSTVSGNTAASKGGGVYGSGQVGSIRADTVFTRSLISGNVAPAGAEVHQASGGVVTANYFNLFGHSGLTTAQALGGAGQFLSGPSDITATSDATLPTALSAILSSTLALNGGLTQTHALILNGPAMDTVTGSCPPPARDQRGVPRAQDGNQNDAAFCDIGAFELVPPGTSTCDGLPTTKVGTPIGETITGTIGADVIQGLGGNDIIKGVGGNDVLCGGPGTDQVLGGVGGDRLFGEADADKLNGEAGFDRCNGGAPTTDTAANCEVRTAIP